MELPAEVTSFEQLRRSESVAFFVARANTSRPGFELTQDNATVIAEICNRLDGLPLAIELAAARLRVISPETLLSLLNDRLDVLVGGPRDAPERQRTLRNAIAWSFDLLSPEEQRFLEKTSVFLGAFDLAACAAVAECSLPTALEQIAALVDHGLLVPMGSGEHARFRLLATIREFAQEQLRHQGGDEQARALHTRHFLALAGRIAPELTGPDQGIWTRQLELDLNNFRAAHDWLLRRDSSDVQALEQRAQLVIDLWRFWVARGLLSEGRAWAEAVVAAPSIEHIDPVLRAQAFQHLGNMALDQGDLAAAEQGFERNRVISAAIGHQIGLAAGNNGLGLVAYYRGDFAEARARHEQALAIREQLDDTTGLGNSLNNLALVHCATGDYEQATAYVYRGLEVRQRAGDPGAAGYSTYVLADILLSQGKRDEARVLFQQSLEIFTSVADQLGVAYAKHALGLIDHDQEQYASAARNFVDALAIRKMLGDRRGSIEVIEALAAVINETTHDDLAATLFSVADTYRSRYSLSLRPVEARRVERDRSRASRRLSERRFDAAWSAGRSLSLDAAIQLASAAGVAQAEGASTNKPAVPSRLRSTSKIATLTRREHEVLQLVAEGKANAEIASALFIGKRTVDTHVENILNKLDVRSRGAAIAIALQERAS
jgi:DNA-binding CsgD family transcriptional regulator/tetratricopeptide (TPR) repeat protein